IGRGILDNAWQGYNATLLAYGQTGSGKSYSMIGFGTNKGIIPRVCEELFQAIENQETNQELNQIASLLEIHNHFISPPQIRDLLSRTKNPGGLKVREDQQLGFFVEGLKWVPCEKYVQVEKLMEQGTKVRTTASTHMNASSSRSHMVITIQLKQIFPDTALTKQSSINLVDLAGSERQKSSGSEGDRLREGSRVNLSLTSLGNVISALADTAMGKKVLHIPYRDSVLTKLLQSALGGNSRTTLMAAISPADICYEETLSTLRYAERYRVRERACPGRASRQPRAGSLRTPGAWTDSSCDIGQDASNAIILRGLGISDKHATITNLDGKVTVTPHSRCKVVVNGVPITTRTKLQHLDRVILGSNSAYLYVGLPSERGCADWSRFDYDFFQLERAAAAGVSVDTLGAVSTGDGDGQVDPSVLAVFQDYVKLMPLVAEANQMSDELEKSLKMTYHVTREDDPFWDPVEAVHLGSAHIWLQSLAYCMKLEEQVEFLNCDGLEEAMLHIHIVPCSPEGRAHGEEEVVTDPLELLGKRVDFQIHIVQCLGVKWLKEDAKRGVQIGYKIYDLPNTLYTKPVWKSVNPQIEETVQFAALNASQEFLSYLQTNALIVDLWGLQAPKLSDTPKENGVTTRLLSTRETTQVHTQQSHCDRELARALKVFYQGMSTARGQLLRLRQFRPPEDDQMLRPFVQEQSQMLKDLGDLLESSLWKLKNDVALIVKKKREYLWHIKQ
uniref:Kinesin-like protein n=1 Tax=Jaculus jaculus TaxID=51337 RepID=A0A8C5K3Z7_JACJA